LSTLGPERTMTIVSAFLKAFVDDLDYEAVSRQDLPLVEPHSAATFAQALRKPTFEAVAVATFARTAVVASN